jgi:hypothetical protein
MDAYNVSPVLLLPNRMSGARAEDAIAQLSSGSSRTPRQLRASRARARAEQQAEIAIRVEQHQQGNAESIAQRWKA